jgi:hypothetical protein
MIENEANDGARPTAYNVLECVALNNLAHHIHYEQCAFQLSTYCTDILRERVIGLGEYLIANEVAQIVLNRRFLVAPEAAQAA